MKYKPFELAGQEVIAHDIVSNAWVYTRKLARRKEEESWKEKRIMLESLARQGRSLEKMAIEWVDFAFNIKKIIERWDKRDQVIAADMQRLAKRLDFIMNSFDISYIDPTGEVIDDKLAEVVDVINNIPHPGIENHIVGETLSVIVKLRGKVVRPGEIIGWYPENEKTGQGEGDEKNPGN